MQFTVNKISESSEYCKINQSERLSKMWKLPLDVFGSYLWKNVRAEAFFFFPSKIEVFIVEKHRNRK